MGKLILNGVEYSTSGNLYNPVIYSDTERRIGVWRDNKPLYQKTIQFNNVPQNTSNYLISTGVSDIDTMVLQEAYGISASNNIYPLPLALRASTADYNTYSINFQGYVKASNSFRIDTGSQVSVPNGFITFQYTKTTDTAGSGNWNTDGIPTHHYSTNEQVIGTWIDGKPAYERTWDFGSDFNMGNPNTWYPTTISISANKIKRIIGITSAFSSVGTLWDNLGVAININDYVQLNSSRNTGGEAIQYLTLRYTKTTD